MIKKARPLKVTVNNAFPAATTYAHAVEELFQYKHELNNLIILSDGYKIDLRSVNKAGIELALAIAREYVKDFTPNTSIPGNPRNAYELHRELFEAIEANKSQGLKHKEAIEKYLIKIRKKERPNYSEAQNYYYQAKKAKEKQDFIVDELMKNIFV
jgi:hypothetical protein